MGKATKIIKLDSGRRTRLIRSLKVGGQGEAFESEIAHSGEKGVVKVFHPTFATADTAVRVRFLCGEQLLDASPVLCGPTDSITSGGIIGHFTPWVDGQPLEELLARPCWTLRGALLAALAFVHGLAVLEERSIAHGDIHAENILMHPDGSVVRLFLIDFDNFNAPGQPQPPMAGANLYLAPELRKSSTAGRPSLPDRQSDRFALGTALHELILGKHPAAGADGTPEEFERAVCTGRWHHDPAIRDRRAADPGGYPPAILNPGLARLFRRAFSLNRDERPAPAEWKVELELARNAVDQCGACSGQFLVDPSKTRCPICRKSFPIPRIKIKTSGRMLPLEAAATVIGRSDLRGSEKVSARHAVFRRLGPDLLVESHGSNGTYRWDGSNWVRLPEKNPVLLQIGDRLRLADAEVQIA